MVNSAGFPYGNPKSCLRRLNGTRARKAHGLFRKCINKSVRNNLSIISTNIFA